MTIDFSTAADTPEEHTKLIFAIMNAQDALAEAGIESPKVGAIQEVLETYGINTDIIQDSPNELQ